MLAEKQVYEDKVTAERNFLCRYIFPRGVKRKSRLEFQLEAQEQAKRTAASNINTVEHLTTKIKALKEQRAYELGKYGIENAAFNASISQITTALTNADVFGLDDESKKGYQDEFRAARSAQATLKATYQVGFAALDEQIREAEAMLAAAPTMMMIPSSGKKVKKEKKYNSAKKAFMPMAVAPAQMKPN